jgi:hypothetical protein
MVMVLGALDFVAWDEESLLAVVAVPLLRFVVAIVVVVAGATAILFFR